MILKQGIISKYLFIDLQIKYYNLKLDSEQNDILHCQVKSKYCYQLE